MNNVLVLNVNIESFLIYVQSAYHFMTINNNNGDTRGVTLNVTAHTLNIEQSGGMGLLVRHPDKCPPHE